MKFQLDKRQCNICEACQQPDCGECVFCKDMIKFGGSGKGKHTCKYKRCFNVATQHVKDSDAEDQEMNEADEEEEKKKAPKLGEYYLKKNQYEWKEDENVVIVNDVERIKPGDFALILPVSSTTPMSVVLVRYFSNMNLTESVHCSLLL